VLYKDSQEKKILRKHLGPKTHHTMFEAELVGMCMGTELIRAERGVTTATLGADNQAALRTTHPTTGASGQYLADGVHEGARAAKKRHENISMDMRWTPSHAGVEGNEKADAEAKKAAQGQSSSDSHLPKSCRGILPRSKAAAKQSFQKKLKDEASTAFAKSPRFARMHKIDPSMPSPQYLNSIASLPRRHASVITQLLTGHVLLNRHLHKIGKSTSPKCPSCPDRDESVHHFLLVCPAHAKH
jgi:ribonuclease HI